MSLEVIAVLMPFSNIPFAFPDLVAVTFDLSFN